MPFFQKITKPPIFLDMDLIFLDNDVKYYEIL